MVAKFEQLDLSHRYCYADYLTRTFSDRVELFKGWVKKMILAPNRSHQRISWNFLAEISNYLKNTKCTDYTAPFDVRLIGKICQ